MADKSSEGTGREGDPSSAAPHDIGTPLARQRAENQRGDGPGGPQEPFEGRVTRLEAHMDYRRRDIADLKSGQAKLLDVIPNLATKADLGAWKWQWTALAFAVIAIVIGGIIGGLGWIKPSPPAGPPPIVIRLPR